MSGSKNSSEYGFFFFCCCFYSCSVTVVPFPPPLLSPALPTSHLPHSILPPIVFLPGILHFPWLAPSFLYPVLKVFISQDSMGLPWEIDVSGVNRLQKDQSGKCNNNAMEEGRGLGLQCFISICAVWTDCGCADGLQVTARARETARMRARFLTWACKRIKLSLAEKRKTLGKLGWEAGELKSLLVHMSHYRCPSDV